MRRTARTVLADLADNLRRFRSELDPHSPLAGPAFKLAQMMGRFEERMTKLEIERAKARENDARWLTVTDETPVTFDGELSTWGELSQNERASVEMSESGCLVGGYPF
jgi:hypothetical protein